MNSLTRGYLLVEHINTIVVFSSCNAKTKRRNDKHLMAVNR